MLVCDCMCVVLLCIVLELCFGAVVFLVCSSKDLPWVGPVGIPEGPPRVSDWMRQDRRSKHAGHKEHIYLYTHKIHNVHVYIIISIHIHREMDR